MLTGGWPEAMRSRIVSCAPAVVADATSADAGKRLQHDANGHCSLPPPHRGFFIWWASIRWRRAGSQQSLLFLARKERPLSVIVSARRRFGQDHDGVRPSVKCADRRSERHHRLANCKEDLNSSCSLGAKFGRYHRHTSCRSLHWRDFAIKPRLTLRHPSFTLVINTESAKALGWTIPEISEAVLLHDRCTSFARVARSVVGQLAANSRARQPSPTPILAVEMTEQKDHWWNGLWPLFIPAVYFLAGLLGNYVSSPG